MPFETIAHLTFVVSALILFAATLTYAEWATRHANDPARKADTFGQGKPSDRDDTDALRKAA